MPERFVVIGTFIEPKKVSLIPNQPPPLGTYAPALLLRFGTKSTAVATQFRSTGQRLNVPGIALQIDRPDIPGQLSNRVIDPQNPSAFTLVMHVDRGATDTVADAILFVGDEKADSVHYTFGNGVTAATVFSNIRVGIGTNPDGTNYRASVYVTEFEIWAPNPNH
jgi:hypothetical protein